VNPDPLRHDASVEEQIRRGEYRVDERAVADAILRRRRELAALRANIVATAIRCPLAQAQQPKGSTADGHDG
jgi:hypothetical protein